MKHNHNVRYAFAALFAVAAIGAGAVGWRAHVTCTQQAQVMESDALLESMTDSSVRDSGRKRGLAILQAARNPHAVVTYLAARLADPGTPSFLASQTVANDLAALKQPASYKQNESYQPA